MQLFSVTSALGGDLRHRADGWSRMHLTTKRVQVDHNAGSEPVSCANRELALRSTRAPLAPRAAIRVLQQAARGYVGA